MQFGTANNNYNIIKISQVLHVLVEESIFKCVHPPLLVLPFICQLSALRLKNIKLVQQ